MTGAMLTHQAGHKGPGMQAHPALDPNSLTPFVDPLPIPNVAKSTEMRPSPTNAAVKIPYYRVPMRAFETKVHRDMKPTNMWGFGGMFPGPTFDVRGGQEILVEWANELPQKHFLPIDHSLHGAEKDKAEVRAVSHLHGAKAPPESDGYPEDWIVPGKSSLYHYPNQQDAAMLWYHDHAMGINRLNIFAGLAGAYILRDKTEEELRLPRERFELPLVITDRMFDKDSQLYYPVSDKAESPWIPEFFGDARLVNGKLFPFLEVERTQIPLPGAERFEWEVLPAFAFEQTDISPDWDGSGAACGASGGAENHDRAGRAARFDYGFQGRSRKQNHFE